MVARGPVGLSIDMLGHRLVHVKKTDLK